MAGPASSPYGPWPSQASAFVCALKRAAVAPALVSILKRELAHLGDAPTDAREPAWSDDKAEDCDGCRIGILFTSYDCPSCDAAFCIECFEALKADPDGQLPQSLARLRCRKNGRRKKRARSSKGRPSEHPLHVPAALRPTSRMPLDELKTELQALEMASASPLSVLLRSHCTAEPVSAEYRYTFSASAAAHLRWLAGEPFVLGGEASSSVSPGISCVPYSYVPPRDEQLVLVDDFARWAVAADDLPGAGFSVADLLRRLELPYAGAKPAFYLRDWPALDELPAEDVERFCASFWSLLPFPSLVDGGLDLLRCLPDGARRRLGGPALFAGQAPASGTPAATSLHLDACDAVNIMTSDGEAEWLIYGARHCSAVLAFLESRQDLAGAFQGMNIMVDMSDDDVARLRDRTGVAPLCVTQRRGDAVFVPAGCWHQVRNRSGSLKLAADFFSVASIDRVLQVTRMRSERRRAAMLGDADGIDWVSAEQLLWHAWKAESSEAASAEPVDHLPAYWRSGLGPGLPSLAVQQFRLAAAVPLGEKGAQALLHLPSDLGALLHAWPSSALRPDHPCTLCSKLDRAEACMPAAETGRQRKSAAVRCAACMKDRKGCSWQHDAPAGAPAAVSPAEQALGRASDLYWAATLERLAGTGAGPSDALAAICASIHKRSPGNDAQTRALLTELAGAALQGPREMSVATAASAALACLSGQQRPAP